MQRTSLRKDLLLESLCSVCTFQEEGDDTQWGKMTVSTGGITYCVGGLIGLMGVMD